MYRIMIVDDEKAAQDTIRKYIEAKLPEFEICAVADNGPEAIKIFLHTPADIVFVDIRMPLMDGLTLIGELNRITRNYVPIIVSSYGEFEYAKTAMQLGVSRYLLKPVDFDEMTETLQSACETLKAYRRLTPPQAVSSDEYETWFVNLLTGKYSEERIARADFSTLNLPFSYDDSTGICVQVTLAPHTQWPYEADSLYTAISNLIRLIYQPQFLISLCSRQRSCNFLLVDSTLAHSSWDELCAQARQLLNVTLSARSLFSFSSMEELRANTTYHTLMDLADTNLKNSLSSDEAAKSLSAIQSAIAYMKEHYAEDLTRSSLASRFFMSGSHFSRCFKMATNTSYSDYLIELRMTKAMELLKTDLSVSEIARRVGYTNTDRFTINFRHYTSCTPREYRANYLRKRG